MPDIPGLEAFAGGQYHTGRWPEAGVDFTGRRVGIIGTGSSAIQSIPLIAEQAEHLYVFQRTPNYSIPAHNGPLDDALVAEIKAAYTDFRAANRLMLPGFGSRTPPPAGSAVAADPDERERVFEARWALGGLLFLGAFDDLLVSHDANAYAADFVRRKIRAVVKDPEVADLLAPKTLIGCKRLCVDTGYFETFNRPNVTLVDISTAPIGSATATTLRAGDTDYTIDDLVCATGFDAMTGALLAVDIRGRDGRSLADEWADGPRTYLGLGMAGFPNLFTISGPGSPSALTNMIVAIEQHVEFIADCIDHVRTRGFSAIEPTERAQDAWVEHVQAVASFTVYPHCNSWYLGANIPGKPRVFTTLIGFPPYAERCAEVASAGYEGYALTPA
jgi:cyclohexanone monooxygenase